VLRLKVKKTKILVFRQLASEYQEMIFKRKHAGMSLRNPNGKGPQTFAIRRENPAFYRK
jgi:hypothetical protein